MNRKYLGFYLALLITFFKVTGVSAMDSSLFPLADSREEIKVSDAHGLWASEEIFQLLKLPEYSENQFLGSAAIPAGHFQVRNPEIRLLKASFPQRDLKTLISLLLFPFHFFL